MKRGRYVATHLHLNCTYLLEADDRLPIRVKADENSAVRWIPFADAMESPRDGGVANVMLKFFLSGGCIALLVRAGLPFSFSTATVAVVLLLPPRGRRWFAGLFGVGLGLLTIQKAFDLGFYAVLARPFDPVLDWVLFDDAQAFLRALRRRYRGPGC